MAASSKACFLLSQEKAERGLCGGGGCMWDSLALSSFLPICVGASGFAAAFVGSRTARERTTAALS